MNRQDFYTYKLDAEYRFQNKAITNVEADDEEDAWNNFAMIDPNEDWVIEEMDAESFGAESKFDKLAKKIAAQYRKKGKSAKEAMRIGNATAYKIGARKYGKAGMARKARAGMRAEEFGAEDCEGCGLPDDGKCDCTIDLEYCTTCDEDVGSKNLRKCNCGGAVCKDCDYCEMCGNNLDAESFGAEGTLSKFPWLTMGIIGLGAFFATRIKTVDFKADCGCGCKGANAEGCGDAKDKKEAHGYPEVYDPVQDYLPKIQISKRHFLVKRI